MRTVSHRQTLVLHFLEEAEKNDTPALSLLSRVYKHSHTTHFCSVNYLSSVGRVSTAGQRENLLGLSCSMHVDMQHKHDYTQARAHSDMLSLAQLFLQTARHFVIPLFSFQRQHHGSTGGQ